MRNITEVEVFSDDFELFYIPDVRIIGKETRCGGKLGNTAPAFMAELFRSTDYKRLKELPNLIKGCFFDWTGDYDTASDTYSFMHCVMTEVETPVPEGFTYRDIPATICAKGAFGEDEAQTIERAKEMGYETNWEQNPWTAEYFVAEKEQSHWFTPVKEIRKSEK